MRHLWGFSHSLAGSYSEAFVLIHALVRPRSICCGKFVDYLVEGSEVGSLVGWDSSFRAPSFAHALGG